MLWLVFSCFDLCRCKLDIVFVTEDVESMEMVGLYPVNALRNKALQLSQTEVRAGQGNSAVKHNQTQS